MANHPQELAQDEVCQSHTGHTTGLWFLPARPLRLNTNEFRKYVCSLKYTQCNARAPYCHLWPARLYHIFSHYLINDASFEKVTEHKKCFYSLHNFCLKHFSI